MKKPFDETCLVFILSILGVVCMLVISLSPVLFGSNSGEFTLWNYASPFAGILTGSLVVALPLIYLDHKGY